MKKIFKLLMLLVCLLYSTTVHARETRIYSEDNDTFFPIEVTNVKRDSIENIPTDIDEFMTDESIETSRKNQLQDFVERYEYTCVPTFMRVRASKNTGHIIIHAQAPCKLTFLKDGIHTLKYLENSSDYFENYDGSYDIGERVVLDNEFYKTYKNDGTGKMIYGDTLYSRSEAIKYCQDKYYESNPNGNYIYTEPSAYTFAGAKGNSVVLDEGEYYAESLTPSALGAGGFAYYYRYLIKVEAPERCFTVNDNTVKNTSESAQSTTVIIADYTNGVLENVKAETITFEKGEEKSFDFGYGTEHKIFVWDSLSGMRTQAN